MWACLEAGASRGRRPGKVVWVKLSISNWKYEYTGRMKEGIWSAHLVKVDDCFQLRLHLRSARLGAALGGMFFFFFFAMASPRFSSKMGF